MKNQFNNLYESALAIADTLTEINFTAKRMGKICTEATTACYLVKNSMASLALLHHPNYFEIYQATFHPKLGILVSIKMPNGREIHAVYCSLSSFIQQRYLELTYRLLKDHSVRQELSGAAHFSPFNEKTSFTTEVNVACLNGAAPSFKISKLPFNPLKTQA